MINVLLQTTIEASSDDWSVDRFSYLRDFLSEVLDDEGNPSFRVIAHNREKLGAPDSVLSNLRRSDFDEVWLFAVDTGDGLTIEDCQGITGLRKLGRGLMVTRDYMGLGSSVCGLRGVGAAHTFTPKTWILTGRVAPSMTD